MDRNHLSAKQAFLILVAVFVGAFIIAAVIVKNTPPTAPRPPVEAKAKDYKVEAWACAQTQIRNGLKAPRTAKFPWQSEAQITDLGNNSFQINAFVDSENSFGAMLRTKFQCKITMEPDSGDCVYDCDFVD